jgi:hypothetical protein
MNNLAKLWLAKDMLLTEMRGRAEEATDWVTPIGDV